MNRIEDYSAAEMKKVTTFANENEELKDILKAIKSVAEEGKNTTHFFYISPEDVDYVVFKLRSLGYEVVISAANEEGDLYHYVVSW